jgi:tRNA threonylcarbamoyladenosine biosynthesis protein TsaB
MAQQSVPRLLLFETSGQIGQVALAEGETIRGLQQLDEARRHARDLAPAVRSLLRAQGWRPTSIAATIVSRGPGSYTGLRVGIMSAKAFAYAAGSRLIAVDTFQVIAEGVPPETAFVEVIADAQQEHVYCQSFRRTASDHLWQAVNLLRSESLGHWLSRRDHGSLVTGPGLHIYGDRLPESVRTVSREHWEATVGAVLRLGYARFRMGMADDAWTLEPLYLRPSAAEEKWQARVDQQARGE